MTSLISIVPLLIVTVYARRQINAPCVEFPYRQGCTVIDRPDESWNAGPELGIIGGKETAYEDFPFVVALFYRRNVSFYGGSFICGASVLNSRLILTAAHCFHKQSLAEQYYIRGGHENYRQGKIYDVQKFIENKEYNPETLLNDIALAYLTTDLPNSIRRVKISRSFPQNVNKAKVCGWGATKLDHTSLSKVLKCIEFEIFSRKRCQTVLESYWHPSFICAGKSDTTVEQIDAASLGDSGGPIIVDENHQIAMVTAGPDGPLDPKTSDLYNIYTLVSYYHDWIMETRKLFL